MRTPTLRIKCIILPLYASIFAIMRFSVVTSGGPVADVGDCQKPGIRKNSYMLDRYGVGRIRGCYKYPVNSAATSS